MKRRTAFVTLFCLAMTSAAFGQRNGLDVGSSAPGLDIEKWVESEETAIERGRVYLVCFWATTSGPSKEAIPFVAELQEQYKRDLTVIGVSIDENGDVVEPFVKAMGPNPGIRIAIDRRKSTQRAWMDAARRRDIPTAFVVDRESRIAWIGNPHAKADGAELATLLAKVVSGRYDPRLQRQAEPTIRAARSARQMRNWRMAEMHYEEVINVAPRVFADIALEQFEMMLLDMKQKDTAYEYARTQLMANHFAEDAEALQWLAMRITLDSKMTDADRDMDLALEAAEQARDLMGMNNPQGMAVVAQVHFHRGELVEAIDLQKKAYFMARPEEKEGYQRVLMTYQQNAQRTSNSVGK